MNNKNNTLALGTAQFGLKYGLANQNSKVPTESVKDILDRASLAGVKTLDTAIAYGDSEKVLGLFDLDHFEVISKLPEVPLTNSNIPDWIKSQVYSSLERLNQDSLNAVLLHRPLQLTESNGKVIYQTLQSLKHEGIIGSLGVSVYGPDELLTLIDQFEFDIVQAPINILDRRMENSGLLRKLKSQGCSIHARSAFLQGLLLMPKERIPPYFIPWMPILEDYHKWLTSSNVSPLEACINYVTQIEEIDKVIVGVDSLSQLDEILHSLSNESIILPSELQSNNEDLINPSRWKL